MWDAEFGKKDKDKQENTSEGNKSEQIAQEPVQDVYAAENSGEPLSKKRHPLISEERQTPYFKLYARLPLIIAVLTLIAFFIGGIIDATGMRIIGIDSRFLCWLVWMAIGVAAAVVEFFLLKIILSQKILCVIYLSRISRSVATDRDDGGEGDRTEPSKEPSEKK
ncbi:MAG TPA: hypothetical protein IAB69_00010 [Candidatus Coproplasma excrementigallinarum]|uniref:Uncharacterized protein n=1 Tax=Candidatus Coproplasma excrementigallinarum TaxID=2840747 RepID=A0A9D1MJ71_9FIRM|nr:hypothetical protein [Candidatus Coproplasma excrementigallinarum]